MSDLRPDSGKNLPERGRRFWERRPPWLSGLAAGAAVGHLLLAPILALLQSGTYGIAIFVFTPIALGTLGTLLLGFFHKRTWREAWLAGQCSLLTVAIYLLVLRWEGVVCMLMSTPILVPLALLGSWMGWGILNVVSDRLRKPMSVSLGVLVPFLLVASNHLPMSPHRHQHTTVKVIHAKPERIWPLIHNLSKLDRPEELLFRAGIAFPLGTTARGSHRVCYLSTGPMPEKIVVEEPYRRLRFDVLSTPTAVAETNPFGQVFAPHNQSSFRCLTGQFDLTPVANGWTEVRATTWYEHEYAPDWYWTIWTDRIVGAVHQRVLSEIARRTG